MPVLGPILQALNVAGVRYVVVGGVAVVLRGYPRATADLDLIVDLEPSEAEKAIRALEGLGLVPLAPVRASDFADPDARRTWIREKGMVVFSMHDPSDPLRAVDLFVEHPIEFESLWDRSSVLDAGEIEVRVASVDDLIALKRMSARPHDLEDIEALESLKQEGSD